MTREKQSDDEKERHVHVVLTAVTTNILSHTPRIEINLIINDFYLGFLFFSF